MNENGKKSFPWTKSELPASCKQNGEPKKLIGFKLEFNSWINKKWS